MKAEQKSILRPCQNTGVLRAGYISPMRKLVEELTAWMSGNSKIDGYVQEVPE